MEKKIIRCDEVPYLPKIDDEATSSAYRLSTMPLYEAKMSEVIRALRTDMHL